MSALLTRFMQRRGRSLDELPASERIQELLPITARHRVAGDAVGGGPFSVGQMVRPEQAIEEGEMDCEIDVDRLVLDAVMPVMEAGDDEDLFQEAEAPPQIRVDEGRVD